MRLVRFALVAVVVPAAASPAAERAVDWGTAQQVDVVTRNYRFTPSHFRFRQGVAYRLHLDNRGTELHEFSSKAFFATVELRDPDVLNADHTEVAVPPGRHKDVYFVARKPGTFRLICPDHDWAGMVGSITVE